MYARTDDTLPGMAYLAWTVDHCPGCGSTDTRHDRNHREL
jgi:hypothetical protein